MLAYRGDQARGRFHDFDRDIRIAATHVVRKFLDGGGGVPDQLGEQILISRKLQREPIQQFPESN